jgi:hypothetical protein
MNTTENNKLIAEFMGFKLQQDPNERWFGQYFTTPNDVWANRIELLHFDTDWNWLMEVVEKIEDIETIDVDILTNGTRIYEWRSGGRVIADNCANISFDKKIEHTYDSVVEFVQWYNKNK